MKSSRKRSSYKSTEHWLDAVYRKNRSEIDKALEGVKNKRASFKQLVKGYMEEGLSPERSLKALERSTIFTPEVTRFRNNLVEAMKTHGRYQEFRNMTRGFKGRFEKINLNNFRYDAKNNVYTYTTVLGDVIVIRFDNSPEDIILEYL
jgi:hypothetical protein